MAVAIETLHTFTIKQLFVKLCQKYCDGPDCDTLAPYVDVFGLTRRCLSIGRGCRFPCGPLYPGPVGRESEAITDRLPSRLFKTISGRYGKDRWTNELGRQDYLYDFFDMKSMLLSDETRRDFEDLEGLTAYDDRYWKLCSAAAPWLSSQGKTSETGIFCDLCIRSLKGEVVDAAVLADPGRWSLSIREEQERFPNDKTPLAPRSCHS